MDTNVNTKPSEKRVREWPKVEMLSFFVKARELVAEILKKVKKPYTPVLGTAGESVIKRDDYTRFKLNSNSMKLEKFSQPSEVTSKKTRSMLDLKFNEKYPKKKVR